jgi:hypothetical protein
MVAPYPASLPSDPLIDAYRETWVSNIGESQTDSGRPRRFKKYTKPPRQKLTLAMPMKRGEVAIFETWFRETLDDGILPFSLLHPRLLQPVTFWFRADAAPNPAPEKNGQNWRVMYELEFEI